MKLTALLERLQYEVVQGTKEIEITELTNDSRKVTEGKCLCLHQWSCIRRTSVY